MNNRNISPEVAAEVARLVSLALATPSHVADLNVQITMHVDWVEVRGFRFGYDTTPIPAIDRSAKVVGECALDEVRKLVEYVTTTVKLWEEIAEDPNALARERAEQMRQAAVEMQRKAEALLDAANEVQAVS